MIAPLLLAAALLPLADSETELLKDDISFAENLARYQYFDLAAKVIAELQSDLGRDPNSDVLGELVYTQATIQKAESERVLDPVRRAEARAAAIELLSDFSKTGSSFAFHARLLDALENLATLHRARAEEAARRARAGDASAAVEAADDYQAADEALERLQEEAEAIAEQQRSNDKLDDAERTQARANFTLYLRGLNGIDWARVSDDPTFRLEEAIEDLDDFLWEVDEFALLYPMATFEQGRAYATLSRYTTDAEEAAEYLRDARDILRNGVLNEQNVEVYWDSIGDWGGSAQGHIAALFDRTWAFMAELDAQAGDLDAAQKWIDRMRSEHTRLDVRYGPDGLRALLDWAERLNELGQTGGATDIYKFVASNEGGRGTPEGEEAESRLADVVSNQGVSAITSVDVLVSVGRGLAAEGNQADAGYAYLRAYGLMTTDEQRALYAQDALGGAATALRQQGRNLEAAMAYELQLEDLRARQPDDLVAIEKVAGNLVRAYAAQLKATGDDFDKQQRTAAQDRMNQIPGISLDVQFGRAEEFFAVAQANRDAASYLAALAEFEGVAETSTNYEAALVWQGKSLAGAGRPEDALARMKQVLDRADDPAFAPTNAAGLKRREAALAQARYESAKLLLSDEVNRPDDALTMLQDFEEDVPGQTDFHAPAKYQRVLAYAKAGRLDEAEDALAVLRESGATAAALEGAALETYSALRAEAEAARPEGGADARAFWSRAARALTVANEASEYTRFANGLLAAQHFLDAGEPAEAEAVARKVQSANANRNVAAANTTALQIVLATALDEQADFGRARPIWKELLERNPKRVDVLRGAARSYGGWLEADDQGNVTEIAGSGDFFEAHKLWIQVDIAAKQIANYEELWWEGKLGGIYTKYREGAQDSAKLKDARRLLTGLKINFPNFDKDVQERLPEDKRFTPRFFTLLRYLDRKLPA